MGLGGTAKKLQKVVDVADEIYTKMNEVIGQLQELREEVQRTSEQVDRMEYDVAEQRAILDALAETEGIDVEAVLESAELPDRPGSDAEADGESAAPEATE